MKKLDDTSVFVIIFQLLHLSKYQAMKRMEDVGVKPSQAGVLFVLNREGRLSQRELAEKVGITPPSMTVVLRKLENQGYIVKEPDKADQRVIRIILSDKGKECVEELKGTMDGMEEMLFQGLSPEERMLFRRLLLEMRDNLLQSKDFKDMDMRTIMERTGQPMKHNF